MASPPYAFLNSSDSFNKIQAFLRIKMLFYILFTSTRLLAILADASNRERCARGDTDTVVAIRMRYFPGGECEIIRKANCEI